ncbi:cell division protein FtsQ/DivIB [Marinovum sp.]|uniref:cell division protein FtsQ/DivIB n=1 Tax=Marinovum sp. TaxID=2024839 RepID=UPI003A941D59
MPSLTDGVRGRIHRAYHPAHGGPEPQPAPQAMPRPKADPAPSRWAYRMQRLMLTPLFRQGLRLGLPMALAFLIGSVYFASETRRVAFNQTLADMRDAIEQREEFMVKLMQVDGAGEEVAQDIREILPVEFPVSSFHLELDHMRDTIAGLDAVEKVSLRIKPGGILQVDVTERIPAVVWRSTRGLELLDAGGYRVAPLKGRHERPDLPVIAGEGADKHVRQALRLVAAAAPVANRLRGLEWIGQRRWDVVLDRDQRILLPKEKPVQTLERVLALDSITPNGMLERDLAVVDMRLPHRPTIRMNTNAVEELRKIKADELGVTSR